MQSDKISVARFLCVDVKKPPLLGRLVVSPAEKMQKTLVEYTKNKNTPLIVKEMYDIKTQNELGYLSDIISDLALEVDLYTKENVKIAAERERTQKELYQARVQIMVSQRFITLRKLAYKCVQRDISYCFPLGSTIIGLPMR